MNTTTNSEAAISGRISRKSFDFEVKADGEAAGSFKGKGACCHNIDYYGEIIDPGAFDADLPYFVANGFVGGLNHNWNQPIGKITAAVVKDGSLDVAGTIEPTAHGSDVRTLLKGGVIRKLSIGYTIGGREYLETAAEALAYWQGQGYSPSEQDLARAKYGAILLTRIKLYEVSPVTIPANDRCDITATKGELDGHTVTTATDQLGAALDDLDIALGRVEASNGARLAIGKAASPSAALKVKALADRCELILKGAPAEPIPVPAAIVMTCPPPLALFAERMTLALELDDLCHGA